MIKKELEKKIELAPCDYSKDIEYPIELEYYITESQSCYADETEKQTVYGIEIVKLTDGNKKESKSVLDFSLCKENTIEILEKLAENTVTPVGLHYVLDDILGEY